MSEHKGSENTAGHFYVTQDGCAILSKQKSQSITGLYTEYLQTCIAIFVFGEEGMVLFHDTGKIDLQEIRNILTQLGTISAAYVCYNDHEVYQAGIGEKKERVLSVLNNYTAEVNSVACKGGYVWMDRNDPNKVFRFPETIEAAKPFVFPTYRHIRNNINIINNFFSLKHEFVKPDMQFDGINFTKVPAFNKDKKQIMAAATHYLLDPSKIAVTVKMTRVYDLFQELLSSVPKKRPTLLEDFQRIEGLSAGMDDFRSWLEEVDPKAKENKKVTSRSPIVSSSIDVLKTAIKRIIPNREWKVPNEKTIWAQLSDEEEAKKIVAHFKSNKYFEIKLDYTKSDHSPVIVLSNVDYKSLIKIPTLEGDPQPAPKSGDQVLQSC